MLIKNLGEIGIIPDISPKLLPPNAWSDGKNVRFAGNSLSKISGENQIYNPPSVAPYYIANINTASTVYWVYLGLAKAYVVDGTTHTNITRQTASVDVDYNANADNNWTHTIIGGVPVFNNGVDYPQQWSTISPATKLSDLSNWPANTVCQDIRAFKNFLVGLNITKSGVTYDKLVKWSHSTSYNNVPSSWDETDDTKDAGEYELADTGGGIVTGRSIGDLFYIYKNNAIYVMQYIGPPWIFKFVKVSDTAGALSRRCVVPFALAGKGLESHFVFGTDDVFLMSGGLITPILDKQIKRRIYNTIDGTNYRRSFAAVIPDQDEIWLCYPETGEAFATEAVIWNYRYNTVSIRELNNASHIGSGIIAAEIAPQDWNSDSEVWDGDSEVWDAQTYNPSLKKSIITDPNSTKLYLANETEQFNGINITSYVEKTGIPLDINMDDKIKLRHIYPLMTSTGPVNVYIGGQTNPDSEINWLPVKTFDPATDHKVDARLKTRYMAIKIESTTNITWSLDALKLMAGKSSRR